ncbi:hypothetical protein NQ318_001848 [Aromia moschata]|uniref:C2H2-type domain-containing protein n=1 Tax=Aromia moschata TaxID=1265417 RepID=A0AAV8Z2I3_9CUCU|nr:hypothetical protein NQ318_001848 [Aromia moschata]
MMALLLIRRDPKEQDIICFKCTDNLKTCFEFKSSCLCLKNSAGPFANEKGNAKQHLFFPTKKGCSSDILPESHTVCCLCMTSNGHDWYISLADNKSNINLKVQLNKYFPEFILNVTEDLAICTACNVSLADFLKIMDHWSNIWLNVVGNNTDMIRTATKNCTDLNLIVQSNPKCEEDADNVCLKYEDQKSTNPESLLTTNPFDFVKLERQELSIKHEEIDIEMSQDNNKRLGDYTINSSQLENAKMEETKSYQCDKCEFRAKHKSRLQQHMVMHLDPSKVTMYQCDRCEYKAKCKSYLKKHSVIHGDPPKSQYISVTNVITWQGTNPILRST